MIERSRGGIRGGKMIAEYGKTGPVTIIGRCVVTDHIWRIKVPYKEFASFARDPRGSIDHFESIKDNLDLREFLISGTSPEGWDRLFGKEDE